MNLPESKFFLREYIWLVLIVTVGLALRTAAIIVYVHIPESDELAYQSIALNLINGKGAVDSMGNYAMYNVGYPLFILAPVFTLFGDDIVAARFLNAFLGGLAIVFCYSIAKEAGAGKIGRLLAATLSALYLPASVYSVYLLKENLLIPLMLGVIWCALRLSKEPSKMIAISCGILFGLLALTGNAALTLAVPVMFSLAFTPVKLRQKVLLSSLILIPAVLIVTPWMMRNAQVLGTPVLNTNGGFNLYLGNNPAATGMFVSIADTPRGSTWHQLRKQGEVKASETLKEEAITWIRQNPSQFVMLALKKAVLFWTPPFHSGEGKGSTVESVVRFAWAFQYLILLGLAIAGLWVSSLCGKLTAVLWIGIASYTAIHMLFYIIFRYREPIMPLVCVLAAMTCEFLLIQWKNKMISYRMRIKI